jgi:hypothetical protein
MTFYQEDSVFLVVSGVVGRGKSWMKTAKKYRKEFIFDQFVMVAGDDGVRSWEVDRFGTLTYVEDPAELVAQQLTELVDGGDLIRGDSSSFKLHYDGLAVVGDATCFVVVATDTLVGSSFTDYVDTLTFYTLKEVERHQHSLIEKTYTDFRRVGGFLFPFYMHYTETRDELTLSSEDFTERIIVNPTLADSIFEPSTDTLADMEFE